MNTYGWLLLGQTLLALAALGAAGGWALWPFRHAGRPYLWLAAPLAGAFTLGVALEALYFGAGLPFVWCLVLGFGGNAAGTAVCLLRGAPARPPLGRTGLALAVALGAAYWGTVSCNKSSIDAREPTVTSMDGGDTFGYAIIGDWVRSHPASQPPRADVPFEVLPYVNLHVDSARRVTHLLSAVGGSVRGTTSLFSYDWTAGVLFAAGMLALGGAFAAHPAALVLLVAGGAVSNWFALARTGYFGRLITYPGAIALAGLLLLAVERPTRAKLAALAVLGYGVSFTLAPVLLSVVLGMAVGSYLCALALVYPLNRFRDRATSFKRTVLKPAATAVGLYLVTAAPSFALYYADKPAVSVPGAPAVWSVVIPVALDLEPPAMPLLKPETERKLLCGCAALFLVLTGIALRHRQPAAVALLCCALVVPVSWALNQNLLYTFQGIVYPLTLAGVALLAAPLAAARWGGARVAVLAVLLLATAGLRVPQARATADRYLLSKQPHRTVMRQSEARAMRETAGADAIDVALGYYGDNHVVLAEMVAQGVPVRLRSPGWERSLKNWAAVVGCPAPDLLVPKSRFALVERNAYAPPGTERWVGKRLKLIEDRDAVTVMGVADAQEMLWDLEWRPGVWIGNTPTTFLIHNGTGEERAVVLHGTTSAGPSHPDRDRRTLRYKLGTQTGDLSVPTENKAAIPLKLQPGLNRVELSVVEAATPTPPAGAPVALLAFCNWRLEPPALPSGAGP
ncbi:hypothetical protein R5W24_000868 [Gemmata sp. JC717]|uniref:hypothetical protein n=1 Tax=Gemmata algarum TaxID=2975278 RepID=UPI0021BB7C23|nr:hypothetical protein [Gemmata algarum]MDY3551789.1 hypothetical protein [Gemmata algarum]